MQKERFIPREKLGKKARRALDSERRAGWGIQPATRRVESKKLYNRKRLRDRNDGAEPFFVLLPPSLHPAPVDHPLLPPPIDKPPSRRVEYDHHHRVMEARPCTYPSRTP